MATIKARKGFGQLELNQVAFRRDGRVEAQMPFKADEGKTYENGMIVIVDKENGVLKTGTITDDTPLYGILYTSEELYDSRKPGLKNFGMTVVDGEVVGPEGYDVCGRVGYLAVGDRFTTNTFAGTDFEKGNKVAPNAKGEWAVVEAATTGPVGVVAEVYTMPDGQDAIKIAIIKA